MMRAGGPIKVLIVDDSAFFRGLLSQALARHPGLKILPGAKDAMEARQRVIDLHPDVIVLDLELPRISGLQLLARLREAYPVPVIICSGTTTRDGPRAMEAFELGALDVVIKPGAGGRAALDRLASDLAARIRVAHAEALPVAPGQSPRRAPTPFRASGLDPSRYVVVLGASTGGTEAIRTLLGNVPGDFPPIALVQHMPVGFTASFAQRLDAHSRMQVREAVDREALTVGKVLVARGDTHLVIRNCGTGWTAAYTDQTPVDLHCPAVNVLFESAVQAAGPRAIGILLTGMGSDGARGLLALRRAGALTITQDKSSCVVYGMPKAAVELGASEASAAPAEIPELVTQLLVRRSELAPAGQR